MITDLPPWAVGLIATAISLAILATFAGTWAWAYKAGHADGRDHERARRAAQLTRAAAPHRFDWAALSADIQRRHAAAPDPAAAAWARAFVPRVPAARRATMPSRTAATGPMPATAPDVPQVIA
jgi:hypothetical protein